MTGRESYLDAATAIGARLCRDAIWDGERCNWLGDSMEPHGGEWKVAHKSFGPELYSGTSGVALFLATLNRFRPEPLIVETARGALRQALSRAGDIPPQMRHALYSGWFGMALALFDCAALLDDDSLRREALRLVDAHRGAEIDPMSLDVIGGAAGAIAALNALDHRLGDGQYLDEACRYGEHILGHANKHEKSWSWMTMPPLGPGEQKDLTGYSHGAAGVALALLELHARTHEPRYLDAAMQGFAYEREHFSPEQQNWPDFRSFGNPAPEQPGYSMAWCHGAPGIGLSRLRAFALTGNDAFRHEAEAAIGGTYRPLTMQTQNDNWSLCHGLGGNAELFILAADTLGEERYRAPADAIGARGIEAFHTQHNPWPCGVLTGGETPGLLLGLAGIGYFYLRLYDSKSVPSVLLIAD
jgi:lantibiotic modifying enzyme